MSDTHKATVGDCSLCVNACFVGFGKVSWFLVVYTLSLRGYYRCKPHEYGLQEQCQGDIMSSTATAFLSVGVVVPGQEL